MKTEVTRIRLTQKQRQDLDTLATRMGVSRSELIRQFIQAGLDKNTSTQIIKWDNQTVSAIREYNQILTKVGININQLTRKCNQGNTSVSFANEIRAMEILLEKLREVMTLCP